MADSSNERVMEMVRRELEKDPSIKSQELFEKAKKLDSGLGDMNIRQFHARYPLQVKRLASRSGRRGRKRGRAAAKKQTQAAGTTGRRPGRPRGRPRKEAAAAPSGRRRTAKSAQPAAPTAGGGQRGRDNVRAILMQFAGELAGAENRAEVVLVIGKVESYVDRLLKAAGG